VGNKAEIVQHAFKNGIYFVGNKAEIVQHAFKNGIYFLIT